MAGQALTFTLKSFLASGEHPQTSRDRHIFDEANSGIHFKTKLLAQTYKRDRSEDCGPPWHVPLAFIKWNRMHILQCCALTAYEIVSNSVKDSKSGTQSDPKCEVIAE
eukprot:1159360-Pelagomonas_calceolata.AAC.8